MITPLAAHIPRAKPRVFGEKCINADRDKRLRDMGIPLTSTDARLAANPEIVIHEVQVLMSWYDYWADKYKVKYLCREHEKGFKNFYLQYEFNEKSFYENEGEHNVIYDGALVTVDDLEDEIENARAMRDIAGKILMDLRKQGKWFPPERRFGTTYILNPERIEEKGKWATEAQINNAEAMIKLKSDLERFEEANELRRAQVESHPATLPLPPLLLAGKRGDGRVARAAQPWCQGDEVCVCQGKAEMTKSLELRNRKVWQSQYELYKEEHLKTPWMKRGTLRNEEKWCVSGVGCRV